MTKIALHLESGPSGPHACDLAPPSGCSDNPSHAPGFLVTGDVDEDYSLYIIATDINTSVGLSGVSFTIAYSENVYVSGWRPCADSSSPSLGWPASGSRITLGFTECAGKQPGEMDPEGDGEVLLGVLSVYAAGEGRLAVGGLTGPSRVSELTNCAGEVTALGWTTTVLGLPFVALGEVAFGGVATGACEVDGVVEDLCLAGFSDDMYVCCQPGVGCASGLAVLSPRACAYAGGVWTSVHCSLTCPHDECVGVPTTRSTWGIIKTMYQ